MDDKVTINGKKFDPNRIDLTQKKDKRKFGKLKTLKTKWGMKHPFHIHGTQFKVVSVDGKAPPKDMKGKKTLYLWNLVKSQNRSCF